MKDKWRYVTSRKRVQGTKEEIKMKFKNKGKLLKRLNEVMKVLTREKSEWLDESYQLVVTLQQNVNSVSAYVHVEFLIEKMKERGDTEKVQNLEEMRSRVDERTRAALRYVHSTKSTSIRRNDLRDLFKYRVEVINC